MKKKDHFPLAFAVLSAIQAKELLQARADGLEKFMASLDLGLSRKQVWLDALGVGEKERPLLKWQQLQSIADSENKCFRVQNGRCEEIRTYSESSRRTFSLFPTAEAPALFISGFTMHRFKGTSPRRAAAGDDPGGRADPWPGAGYGHRPGLYRHRRCPKSRGSDYHRTRTGLAGNGALEPLVAGIVPSSLPSASSPATALKRSQNSPTDISASSSMIRPA